MKLHHSTQSWLLSYIFVVFAAFTSITRWSLHGKKGQKIPLPPSPEGPLRLPVLGSLLSFFDMRKDLDQTLIRLARKYGALCMLWFGTKPVMIINTPRAAKDLLDKVSEKWKNSFFAPRK